MKKSFIRAYSLNVARLKTGSHEEQFAVDRSFFAEFPNSLVEAGDIQVDLKMNKYETHLDVNFHIYGLLSLTCDRCLEPYPFPIDAHHQIIYSFDPEMDFKGYEVMYVASDEPYLSLVQEIYDFVHLEIPLRKVPEADVHLCEPEVLAYLGLDSEGNPLPKNPATKSEDEELEDIDPRWEKLKQLRNEQDN